MTKIKYMSIEVNKRTLMVTIYKLFVNGEQQTRTMKITRKHPVSIAWMNYAIEHKTKYPTVYTNDSFIVGMDCSEEY